MEPIDLSFLDETNAILGTMVVIADYIFGDHWILFVAFLALNLIDWVTGMAKARILKNENSHDGLKGVFKKFGYWCTIAVAFLLAPVFNELGSVIGADVSFFSPLIGYMVMAMLIVNEFRSVLENLYQCGVDVPVVLIKGLSIVENAINEKQEKIFDGHIKVTDNSEEAYTVKFDVPVSELEHKDSVTLRIQTVDDDEE